MNKFLTIVFAALIVIALIIIIVLAVKAQFSDGLINGLIRTLFGG